MPVIKVVDDYQTKDTFVSPELVIETIEKNRDRIRTISNMILTTAGIFLSVLFAVVPFAFESLATAPQWKKTTITIIYGLALFTFLLTVFQSIYASLLRQTYSVTRMLRFIDNLLELYYSELKHLRIALAFLLIGIMFLIFCQIIFFL